MSEKTILTVIRYALYGMLVLVPLIFALDTMFPFVIVKTALFQALAEIVITLWLALAVMHKEYRPRLTPLATATLIFLVVLTAASLFGKDIYVSMWSQPARSIGLVALWHFGLLFLALSSLVNKIDYRTVFTVSVVTSIVASLSGLFTYLLLQFFRTIDFSRPGGVFGNPTFLAGYLLFNIFIALWLVIKEQHWNGIRIVATVGLIIDVFGLMRTQTRSDMIGVIAGFFVIILYYALRGLRPFSLRSSILKNRWLLMLAGLLLIGTVFIFTRSAPLWQGVPGVQRLTNINLTGGDFANRLLAWESGWRAFLDRPMLGWGWENYNLGFQHYYSPKLLTTTFDETYFDKPHNLYLEYAVTGGAASLFAYCALLGTLFYAIFRSKDSTYKAIMLGLVSAYIVRSSVIFDTIGTYLMFFVVLAFVDATYCEINDKRRTTNDVQPTANGSAGRQPSAVSRQLVVRIAPWIALAFAVAPIYFLNWRMVYASYLEHGGPSGYLLRKPQESADAFRATLDLRSIYRDYALENYASVVKQAYADKIVYPDIEALVPYLVDELRDIIRRHPENYFHYTLLAEFENQFAQFNSSYLSDADSLTEKAFALSPERQQIFYVRAKTKLLKGERDEAYDLFRQAVELNPDAGDPHFYFGLLAFERGDAKQGIEEIARAESLGRVPRDAAEAEAVGTLMGDVAGNYKVAVRYYEMALGLNPETAFKNLVALRLGIAYYYAGDKARSRDIFNILTSSGTDLKKLPIFHDLKPLLDEVGARY